MGADEKKKYRNCKVRYNIKKGWHSLNQSMKRGFPVTRLREMVFRGRWFPDIDREYIRFAIFRGNGNYWTIVLRLRPCCIHADTVWPSKPREIRDFKSKKRKFK